MKYYNPGSIVLFAFILIVITACEPNTYQNPVIPGDFPDPSVIRVDDTYYAVGTSSEWGPHYPIYTRLTTKSYCSLLSLTRKDTEYSVSLALFTTSKGAHSINYLNKTN